MAAPNIYRSTDANAPVLSGLSGFMATDLFRAVCVTGYGDKPALGFEEYYPGTADALIIRSPASVAGNRPFFKITNISIDYYNDRYRRFSIQSFDSMSDTTTGAGATPIVYVEYSYYGGASARNVSWDIIGTAAGFHMFFERIADGNRAWSFIGSGIAINSMDGFFNCFYGSGSNRSTSPLGAITPPYSLPTVATGELISSRRSTGDAATIGTGLTIYDTGILGGLTGSGSASVPALYNYPYNGKLLHSRPIVNDGIARSLRGWLPGLYYPQHQSGLIDKQIYPDGSLFLQAYKISGGFLLIDIGEGFRP